MQTTINESVLTGTVRAYPGCRMHFRKSSDDTNNSLAVIDITNIPGSEPPRHIHQFEDELVMIRKGEVAFYIGDDVIEAKTGDVVFMPRGIPHNFKVRSEKAMLTLVVTPGRFDHFFAAITVPFEGDNVPPLKGAPTKEQLEYFGKVSADFGVQFV